MARKLTWKDLAALTRYQNQKMILDNSLQFVHNPGLISSSLLSIISPSSGFYTTVERVDSHQFPFLLGQICCDRNDHSARIAYLAPSEMDAHPAFYKVVSNLVSTAGEKGAVQILAEVTENLPAEEIMYQAGFRQYAEQQIWKVPRRIVFGSGKKTWLPLSNNDVDAVISFYQRILPVQILRVEPPPTPAGMQGMICWKEGKIVGFAAIQFGPKGILVDILLAPELDQIDDYISALVFHLPYRDNRDIYFRVRSYQQGVKSALERLNAEPGPRQKAVVKRLAVHYNAKQTFRMQSFEKQPDITTPISNTKN